MVELLCRGPALIATSFANSANSNVCGHIVTGDGLAVVRRTQAYYLCSKVDHQIL